jgi:hypothetical protein
VVNINDVESSILGLLPIHLFCTYTLYLSTYNCIVSCVVYLGDLRLDSSGCIWSETMQEVASNLSRTVVSVVLSNGDYILLLHFSFPYYTFNAFTHK